MIRRAYCFLLVHLIFVAVLLQCGCEEDFSPILESNRKYTIYGLLDMNRDTQYVRVIPIRSQIDLRENPEQDINFTFFDLTTNKYFSWRDTVIEFSTGAKGLLFYSVLKVQPGHAYQIQITDTESNIVTSTTTIVPQLPRAIVKKDTVIINVTTGGIVHRGAQIVQWERVSKKPFRIDMWYRFIPTSEGLPFVDVKLPYEPQNQLSATSTDSWDITLDLSYDRLILDTLVTVRSMALAGLGMQLTVLDTAFVPPGGTFDPEIIAQPEMMLNVENGFGFFGSVGRFSVEWVLSKKNQELLDYLTMEEAFGKTGRQNHNITGN